MSDGHVGLVVEGPGDAAAAPILLDRIAEYKQFELPNFSKPIPCGGIGEATKDTGIEGFIATAANRPGCLAVVVLLDGEGRPVCQLGPELLQRVKSVIDLPVMLGLADFMFESWLVASSETLRLDGLTYNNGKSDPVAGIRRALGNKKYAKPTWQPRLTERIDIELASKRSHSLRRFATRLEQLVAEL